MEAGYNLLTSAIINHPVRVGTSVLFTAGLIYLGLLMADADKSISTKLGRLADLGCTFFNVVNSQQMEMNAVLSMDSHSPITYTELFRDNMTSLGQHDISFL